MASHLPGPSKKNNTRKNDDAQVTFNPAGFYEVNVRYEHVSKLATGCGFQIKDVEEVIAADNAQRRLEAEKNSATDPSGLDDEEYDPARFEPDPNDEFTSEEELS